jgi:rare lipoprotein A
MQLRINCRRRQTYVVPCLLSLLLVGCGSVPQAHSPLGTASSNKNASRMPVLPPAGSGRGGYYMDDGPADHIPDNLLSVPDAEPKIEPYMARCNKPYAVFGKTYVPITDNRPFKQRGIGSWYGKKFHGQKTSSGELYDMFKMTAAHPTLPIPSYARVTNLKNGAQVIVRINDRGPFLSNRIIDLSYTAALKLGYVGKGSGELEVERLLPDEIERMAEAHKQNVGQSTQQAALNETGTSAPAMQKVSLASDSSATSSEQPAVVSTAAVTMPVAEITPVQNLAKPLTLDAQTASKNSVAPGFYLQFGAFSQTNSAEAMRNKLLQKWISNLPPIEVVQYRAYYRLYSGPYVSRADAVSAALHAREAGLSKPMIVRR